MMNSSVNMTFAQPDTFTLVVGYRNGETRLYPVIGFIAKESFQMVVVILEQGWPRMITDLDSFDGANSIEVVPIKPIQVQVSRKEANG